MNKKLIKSLVELIEGTNIKKIEVRDGDQMIVIETHSPSPVSPAPSIGNSAGEGFKHQEVLPPSEDITQEEKKFHVIKSPLVGTFYRSPSPGAPPFVEVGDMVSQGQVLCIIEALKVMNEIESDVDGRVEKILVENGETVEYGQPLFLIDTNV